ncbi:SdpA family antimicrobial peptide system protein [Bacillus xiapuensis]|uniref:SdpA family antimicrobial peptide system protein n=1 Tax=Bacillus xiapuensis TaxID=2014075 RepID=UPI0012FE4326|nr:SdpA family antimicrobial peptide system protein [Bacillus xiapuensis]
MYKKSPALIFIFSVTIGFLLIFLSITSALPVNTLNIDKELKGVINEVLPQGWGFFSKSPREPDLNAVPLEEQEALQWPNNSLSNYLGISREGRAQGIELGSIIGAIDEESYQNCENDVYSCFKTTETAINIENTNKNPSICGKWGVVNQEPVPWAWGDQLDSIIMPSTIVKVDVEC